MATNQSDFERERQRILSEIEARARQKGGDLTLQDWLKAAEEVMPDEDRRLNPSLTQPAQDLLKTDSQSDREEEDVIVQLSSASPLKSAKASVNPENSRGHAAMEPTVPTPDRKNIIFFSIILITFVILLSAIGGFAYLHIQKEVKMLSTSLTQVQQQLGEINIKLETLEKQQITGGNSALLDALLERIAKLEQQVAQQSAATLPMEQVSAQIKSELSDSNVITEAVLDAKLEQFSRRIEQAIDRRFATILVQLKHLKASGQKVETAPASLASETAVENGSIQPPVPPALPQPPALPVTESSAPSKPAGEQWLLSVPNDAFVLQLASVLDAQSLARLKKQKGLHDAHIVRQKRGGQTFFVLVTGHYPTRVEAKQAAQQIRAATGINPWVRPAGDLKRHLP